MTSPGQRDSQNGRACQLRAVIQMQDYDEISKGEIRPRTLFYSGTGASRKDAYGIIEDSTAQRPAQET